MDDLVSDQISHASSLRLLPDHICHFGHQQRKSEEIEKEVGLLLDTLVSLEGPGHSIIQIVHGSVIDWISEHTE